MLRVFTSFLIALFVLVAPQVSASQAGMHSGMVAAAMNGPSGAEHHAAPAQACADGECQTSLEQCVIACISLPAALSRTDGIGLLVAQANAHWPPDRAQLRPGQEPPLPEQPPRLHLL
ncbi:hypothetical protein [Aquamicrobium defluvii]|jgi:hypothetical protein|uniref:CopL family metal-binding regulatory protein n=1 Tax=Aquamicrobium defluvii TaxID=69279 RepID=A0A011UP58_9HYPH|nr:hypothetical protein [Aquamicrobium defluvii]EXL07926.1 hypothetical protein BG36_04690 [Aquamicrobium defluvii]EZQ15031.1 hypothetical protein CF98_13710 [Halopseudomonas bauzanensis]